MTMDDAAGELADQVLGAAGSTDPTDPAEEAAVAEATRMLNVLSDVINERIRQDRKWGGPEHDDQHEPNDFGDFIIDRLSRLEFARDPRKAFIETAALAVAAIQSLDRKSSKES